jgi:hypothetical protein
MVIGIQILGLGFGLMMGYLTFVAFRRKTLDRAGVIFWAGIWGAFLFAVIFPGFLQGLVGRLNVIRLMDLLMVLSFLVLFGLAFWIYTRITRIDGRIEEIAVAVALDKRKSR